MLPRPKTDPIEVRGVVRMALPNATFRVALDNGHRVLASALGAMRLHARSVLPGDRVLVEVSADDLTRGRLVRRLHRAQ